MADKKNTDVLEIGDLPPPPDAPAAAPVLSASELPPPLEVADLPPPPATTPEATGNVPEGPFQQSDIDAIAAKHGVDREELRKLAPYFGAELTAADGFSLEGVQENLANAARESAGFLGRNLGFGIPQFIYKKNNVDPKMERALDEVTKWSNKKRGLIDTATEFVTPGGAIGTAAKSTLGKVLGGAATGATYGLTGSEQGKEVESTAKGAALGLALSGILSAGGKAIDAIRLSKETGIPLAEIRKLEKADRSDLERLRDTLQKEEIAPVIKQESLLENPVTRRELGTPEGTGTVLKEIPQTEVYLPQLLQKVDRSPAKRPIEKQVQLDIDKGAAEVAAKLEKTQEVQNRIGFTDKYNVSPEEARLIVLENKGPDFLKKIESPSTAEYRVLAEGKELPVVREARDILDDHLIGFASELEKGATKPRTREEAARIVQDHVRDDAGLGYVQRKYKQYTDTENALSYIRDSGIRAVGQPGLLGNAINKISDNQFVLRGMDKKYGTQLEPTLSDMNRAVNRLSFAEKEYATDLSNLYSKYRKEFPAAQEGAQQGRIFDAVFSKDTSKLLPEEKALLEEIRGTLDKVRSDVRGELKDGKIDRRVATTLPILQREDYLPHMLMDTEKIVPLVEKKAESALAEADALLGRRLETWSDVSPSEVSALVGKSKQVREITGALDIFGLPNRSGAEIENSLRRFADGREAAHLVETKASALMRREDRMPEFLLEKNLYKLASKYRKSILKHAYMEAPLSKWDAETRKLEALRADVESEYARNIVADFIGTRPGTWNASTSKASLGYQKRIDRLADSIGPGVVSDSVRNLKVLPDVMSIALGQIHPNVLGLSPRAALTNLTQTWTKVAPELGGLYGQRTALRAVAHTALKFKEQVGKVEDLGFIPDALRRSQEKAVQEGIRESVGYNVPINVLESMGKVAMAAHDLTEKFNRSLVLSVGELMARDLAGGPQKAAALKTLAKWPTYVQKKVQENMSDPQAVSEIIGRYLNDVTQYNYNKVSMSQFGRTVGPLLSTFTKWPTATLGDIVQEYRSKSILPATARVVEKYFVPLAMLEGGQQLVNQLWPESDTRKLLLGSSGLRGMSPIGSAAGLATGEAFTSPPVDLLTEAVIGPLSKGKAPDLGKGAQKAFTLYAPGSNVARFLFDDLTTLRTGHKGKGGSVERIVHGVEDLAK